MPRNLIDITDLSVEEINQMCIRDRVLMGTSTAGIAHAAIVGHLMDLPMGYVRSGNKDHGRQNRIEEMCIRDRVSSSR